MQSWLRRTTILPIAALLVALTAAPVAAASDTKLAEEGVILTSDVPSTWQSSPPDDSSDKELDKAAAKISDCKQYVAVRKTLKRTPNAESREFAAGGEDLSNEVWVFATAAKAKKAFSGMSGTTIADCFTALFQGLFEAQVASDPDVTDVRVAIAQTTDLPAIGDDVIGYAGGAEVTLADGTVQRLPLGNFGVRVGRSILSYTISGAPTATGQYTTSLMNTFDRAINTTVQRMEAALK